MAFAIATFIEAGPIITAPAGSVDPVFNAFGVGGIVGVLLTALLAVAVGRPVRLGLALFSFAVVLGLFVWLIAAGLGAVTGSSPWVARLVPAAIAAASVAGSWPAGAAIAVLCTGLQLVTRIGPWSAGEGRLAVALDTAAALVTGGIIVAVVGVLLAHAARLDRDRDAAAARFRSVSRREAIEAERLQVDALVHDSVLTTLLTAARARDPESQALVATMARDALERLGRAAEEDGTPDGTVALTRLSDRLERSAQELSAEFQVTVDVPASGRIPGSAADALHAATLQAMVNSAQHAGPARRRLHVGWREGTVVVEVDDDGVGFDLGAGRGVRMGVRFSILERMRHAGGSATVESRLGAGTRVHLVWPDGPGDLP
ncbi:MAG: hypothetical protein J0G30_05650 [Actinomycetales bacterium]|nr:hypothetical protein [Actinomycetales bacterium]